MFYQDYIDVVVGVDDLKKSLGALNWAVELLSKFENQYVFKVRRSSPQDASKVRREAFGRIASVVYRIEDELNFLDFAKSKLRNMHGSPVSRMPIITGLTRRALNHPRFQFPTSTGTRVGTRLPTRSRSSTTPRSNINTKANGEPSTR